MKKQRRTCRRKLSYQSKLPRDPRRCNKMNEEYSVHKVRTCYAFKLLCQELMAINILPRIKVKENIYTDTTNKN